MSIGKRVKELRQTLKLSQPAFGQKLGVGRDVIANIELERVPVRELTLKMICKTFNVNPLWLEAGEGEMFLEMPQVILDELTEQYDLSPTERSIVENYLKMPPEDRRRVHQLLKSLLGQ